MKRSSVAALCAAILVLSLSCVASGQAAPPERDAKPPSAITAPVGPEVAPAAPVASVPVAPATVTPAEGSGSPVLAVEPVAAMVDPVPPIPVVVDPPKAEPSFWANIGVQLLGYLLPGIAALLSALLAWLLITLQRKLGLNLDVSRDAHVRNMVRSAIAGAEEWAARKLKVDSTKVNGSSKAQWAIDVLRKQFPDALPDELNRLLDEELGTVKGVGATKDKAFTVR